MQLQDLHIILFFSIPLTAGLVGWLTNILAIQMTFYPIRFIGIRPLGWQGIVPSKAKKIAEKSVDLLTLKLLNIEESFQQLEIPKLIEILSPSLQNLARQLTDEVMDAQYKLYWNNVSYQRKQQWTDDFQEEITLIMSKTLSQIQTEVKSLLDLKTLSIEALTSNKALLNQVFWRCGKKEFRFIERSGLYFGIPLGIIQLVLLMYFPPFWTLSFFGLILGYCTNWLAIYLIFRPLKPKSFFFGLFKLQGLFLKRQKEVSNEYAQIISQQILTTESMLEYIIRGPQQVHLDKILENNILTFLQKVSIQQEIQFLTPTKIQIIKNILTYRLKQELPLLMQKTHAYFDYSLNLEDNLHQKMNSLSPEEFEKFLRPAFQEDEWVLIWVGSILGFLAGLAQYFILF